MVELKAGKVSAGICGREVELCGLEETAARLRWAKAELERILGDGDDAKM